MASNSPEPSSLPIAKPGKPGPPPSQPLPIPRQTHPPPTRRLRRVRVGIITPERRRPHRHLHDLALPRRSDRFSGLASRFVIRISSFGFDSSFGFRHSNLRVLLLRSKELNQVHKFLPRNRLTQSLR